MAAYSFIGTWEINRCVSQNGPTEKSGIEGTQFHLDESGDVTWTVAEGVEALPLFSCETYEVYSNSHNGVVIRFGAYAGHVIEFRVDHPAPHSSMLLTCESWCILQCSRVPGVEPETPLDFPYSLLPALEEGFFSDVTIRAENNKKFAVHSCVLRLGAPELDWDSWLALREENSKEPSLTLPPPPLSGLPEDVLATVLHYIYSQSLPPGLSEETAHKCVASANSLPGFSALAQACQLYLNNMALKHQIIGLVTDMHACAGNIVNYFSTKASPGEPGSAETLGSNPARLCFIVKQAVRESAVAAVKLVLLCELFSKRKSELSREERHEVVRYAKSRLPVFLSQLCRLLHGIKATFSAMSSTQRHELATYLVPEIETVLDAVSSLAGGLKVAIEQILVALYPGDPTQQSNKPSMTELLSRSLRNVLHIREMTKLRKFHQRITCSLVHLLQKKESFSDMTTANKVRSVSRNLEQLIEEMSVFLLPLEEVMAALDDKLEWREFKFCFKVGTSKVSGALQKLLGHKSVLHDTLVQLCEMVQRDAFTQSLVALGLLEPPASFQSSSSPAARPSATGSQGGSSASYGTPKQHGYKLNLVESFCVPPVARNSRLATSALQLLHSGDGADMLFEVVTVPAVSDPAAVVDSEPSASAASAVAAAEPEVCTFKAHRVIVAARCDWFRRALLSGMRESIDRKIVVHDSNPGLFRTFLDYLYCGRLEASCMSADVLTDLMLLADRYELDCLKQACEHALKAHIDDDSALYLLSMADQFNARLLRSACLNFISLNPDSMESELFEELPQSLQAEVYDQAIWVKPKRSQTSERLLLGSCPSPDNSPTSMSSSLGDLEDMTSQLHLRSTREDGRGSMEELLPDPARLEACLSQLQDIVGEGASHERLVQVALAADYDVNRALNFFFSSFPPSQQ